jgi:hexosaminidase
MRTIYEYDVIDNPLVIGLQANLWTERVRTRERLDYMIFPSLIALAERAWTSGANLQYDDFLKRLENEYKYLDSIKVYYYDFRDFGRHPEPLK